MNNSHKTAMSRNSLSSAAKYLVEEDLLKGRVLDYGCGKGYDAKELRLYSFDPYYTSCTIIDKEGRPTWMQKYDTIMCNFVLNTLPKDEWEVVLDNIKKLLAKRGTAYIAVRNDRKNLNGITKKGTFQIFVELDLPVVKKTGNFIMYSLKNEDQ